MPTKSATPKNKAYAQASELAAYFSVSPRSIWRWPETKNGFPAPVRLSANCTRWRWADIEAWEASREVA